MKIESNENRAVVCSAGSEGRISKPIIIRSSIEMGIPTNDGPCGPLSGFCETVAGYFFSVWDFVAALFCWTYVKPSYEELEEHFTTVLSKKIDELSIGMNGRDSFFIVQLSIGKHYSFFCPIFVSSDKDQCMTAFFSNFRKKFETDAATLFDSSNSLECMVSGYCFYPEQDNEHLLGIKREYTQEEFDLNKWWSLSEENYPLLPSISTSKSLDSESAITEYLDQIRRVLHFRSDCKQPQIENFTFDGFKRWILDGWNHQ